MKRSYLLGLALAGSLFSGSESLAQSRDPRFMYGRVTRESGTVIDNVQYDKTSPSYFIDFESPDKAKHYVGVKGSAFDLGQLASNVSEGSKVRIETGEDSLADGTVYDVNKVKVLPKSWNEKGLLEQTAEAVAEVGVLAGYTGFLVMLLAVGLFTPRNLPVSQKNQNL